jgi:cell division septation protein DedD
MVEERRQHSRLVPISPMFVSLDHSKSGLLLDVGEGGLAIASLVPRELDDVISVAFGLPDGRGSIQAEAEIAWTRDSGHLTGARFLNVDDHSLRQLCDWISATPKTAPAAGVDQVDRAPEQLALIAEEKRAAPGIEEADHPAMDSRAEAISEEEVTVVHDDLPGDFGEPLEMTEAPAGFPAPEGIAINGSEVESAAVQEACAEDAAAQAIPSHSSDDAFQSIQGNAISDAPIFVTRPSYAQVAPAVSDVAHEPAPMTTTNAAWQPMQEARAAGSQVLTELGLSSGATKGRHTIELILAVVVLSWALVFLGYQMGSTGVSRQNASDSAAMASASVAPATSGKSSESGSRGLLPSVQASPAPAREAPASLTVGDAGVVLQVGAMKLEDNADVLAQELQKKNMPAFVFRHGQDRLYRVAVGPFSDDDATAKMKAKLEKQGLKPIVRRWLPE